MSDNYKRYMVTAALPYANGPLHIGHIAGAYLPSDIYARFLRMNGKDVAFVCGSDEHGAAITLRAKKEGITPQAIVDKYHGINKETFERFGISFDIYHRTSEELHKKTSQEFFLELYKNGRFKEIESEQFYDEKEDQFLADRYIKGDCPKCGFDGAYGDQCEKCGSALSPTELINPKSTISGNTPILKKTKHWFLPMDEHEAWLREWIETGVLEGKEHHDPKEWKNHVLGQCKAWIDSGLQARSMTRDLDWGVPVPLEDADGKVLYVWLDAPIGYISATKQWAEDNGKNWEDYWRSDESKLVHFIGKDNIVFHCLIFPIILKTHGGYNLPVNVPANEFLNLEGQKLSTSRNWAVWLHEFLDEFPDKTDVLRYVLTAIAPENKDSEFTWKEFQIKNNNELVADFGNFVNRVLVLTHKYFDGEVPTRGEMLGVDTELAKRIEEAPAKVAALIEQYRFKEAQFEVLNLARAGNKYLADMQPWKLGDDDKELLGTIMNLCLQVTANLAILIEPFLPNTSKKLCGILGVKEASWQAAGSIDILTPFYRTTKPELLFNKIDDKFVEEQVAKLEKTKFQNTPAEPLKEAATFDDFTKMDIRVATILSAEKVKKTKKLLKIQLDTGIDKRTVVSGIAEYYKPDDIIGKEVLLLANLAPRAIKGIESEGMILMAEDRDGSLSFVSPEKQVMAGSTVR